MSTSDGEGKAAIPEGPAATDDWATLLNGAGGLPSGFSDPAVLARMANDFFTALPGGPQAAGPMTPTSPQPPAGVNGIAAPPYATAPTVPSAVPSFTEAVFGAVPSTAYGSVPWNLTPKPTSNQAWNAAPPATTLPSVGFPGIPGAADPLGGPIFSFLDEIRPRFSAPAELQGTVPSTANSPKESISAEKEFAGLLSSLRPNSLPAQAAEMPQPPAPTAPGGLGIDDSSMLPQFSFMEEARPIFSYPPAIPGPVPALPGADVPTMPGTSVAADGSSAPRPPQTETDGRAPQAPAFVAYPAADRAPVSYDFLREARPLVSPGTVPALGPVGFEPALAPGLDLSSYSFDVEAIRRDFPILRERVHGRPLVWLDNAATTQKPQSVIDRLDYFYSHENSNVHRAAHELAARATDAYESAREKVRRFLNASSFREIIFVRGATEAINLIAQSWGRQNIRKDDEIVITWLEHHANIVPWQMLCSEKGARLRVAPVDDRGQVLLDEYEKLLGPKTRLVSVSQVSNALGTVTPVREMIEAARRHGARVVVDGAQAVSHMRVDVQSLNCDFYVFSGHKLFAPTGIGVVYGKSEVLDTTPPWQGGGNMIQDVTFERTIYQPPPGRFEAGTGNIADAVGLGAAIDYLDRVGMANIARHEHELLIYATEALQRIPGLHLIGTAKEKAGVLSFVLDGFRTEEIGDFLNRRGIAVRAGHHCAQPILRRFGLESTLRASLALYNTFEEIDVLVAALWDLRHGRNPGLA